MSTGYRCPPEHGHGATQTCYGHGCRCEDCMATKRDYSFWRRNMHRAGRGPVKSVDATGTRRRIEALMALGWPAGELARRLATTFQQVNVYRTGPRVAPSTAERVAALYEQLWNQRPEPTTMGERVAVSKTLSFARGRGFALPLDWDDIDADEAPQEGEAVDVDEVKVLLAVEGMHPRLTVREREEAVRALHARGLLDPAIAELLDVDRETAYRIRHRLGLPERFGQPTTRREDAA